MLSVRLPKALEDELTQLAAEREVTKSHMVQEALTQYLVEARASTPTPSKPEPDLSFLAPDDPIRQFIGICREGPSTDEWMAITRGEDWNKP